MPAKQILEVDGKDLVFSNADKIFFPATGYTKGQVIAFYAKIAGTILPHLEGRPLTMKRYPDGVTSPPFYEKNAPAHRPGWVETFPVPRSEGGADINYILCNDRATLLWATNLGDIEKHTLLACVPDLNCPTALVFDLDPGAPADIIDCCHVALSLRAIFDTWGLQSFVKVSGSKGLHLSVPLNLPASYEVTQPFAKALAQLATRQDPGRVVFEMSKTLRKGKVLIDWSQNSDFKTTVRTPPCRSWLKRRTEVRALKNRRYEKEIVHRHSLSGSGQQPTTKGHTRPHLLFFLYRSYLAKALASQAACRRLKVST